MRWYALALLVTGCGFEHGRLGGGGDAATVSGDGAHDTGVDSVTPIGPWSAPTRIAELTQTGTSMDDPTLTADMLEIYFNSNRSGNDEIWKATRATTADAWSSIGLVTELNSAARESDPEVAPDGLTIWFASERMGGSGADDLYMATRLSRAIPWSTPIRLVPLCSNAADAGSTVGANGTRIIFWSTRSGGAGGADLYEAIGNANIWGSPQRIAALSTSANDYDPFFTPDALTVFFDSERPGVGMQDLHVATRPALNMPFGSPQRIDELNTIERDMDPWLTPDLRTMVFASTRSGQNELYITTR